MKVIADISVEAEGWRAVPALEALAGRSLQAAADEAAPSGASEAEVSLLFCDDDAIRALNRDFRGKDKATNVLSFPAGAAAPPGAPRLLGDVAVAYGTTAREAREEGKSLADHAAHLLVHGMLHLLGFDHETPAEAEAMEAAERRALARLGVADPYADTDPVEAVAP